VGRFQAACCGWCSKTKGVEEDTLVMTVSPLNGINVTVDRGGGAGGGSEVELRTLDSTRTNPIASHRNDNDSSHQGKEKGRHLNLDDAREKKAGSLAPQKATILKKKFKDDQYL
jgi:hypothetical protein